MPWRVHLCRKIWIELGDELEAVVLRHPRTWPGYSKGDVDFARLALPRDEDPDAGEYVDAWGCTRRAGIAGHTGTYVGHPLADWAALEGFRPPDPDRSGHMGPTDWSANRRAAAEMARSDGPMNCWMGLDHGYHLLRLEYLRGFENLMIDLVDQPPQLQRLIEMVHGFNKALVARWLKTDVPMLALPEDLGASSTSMIGPPLTRRWVLPYHRELHGMAHTAGRLTYFHTDGYVMDIADVLLETGADVLNVQDRLNGAEELARAFQGRVCIDLDFDRQHAAPFGTPAEIGDLVAHEVGTLGSREGGLMLAAEIRSGVPPENIDAIASAMEEYSTYWFR